MCQHARRGALDLLPRMKSWFDEPFADESALPTYLVSKVARENVTVVLTGDGGDEGGGGATTRGSETAGCTVGADIDVTATPRALDRAERSDAARLSTDAVQAADAIEPATRTALVATAEPTTAPSRTASLDAVRKRLPLPTASAAAPPSGNASMNASRVLEVPRINFLVNIG